MKLAVFAVAGILAGTSTVAGPVPGLFNTGVDESGTELQVGSPDIHYMLTGPLSNSVVVERHFSSPNHTWVAAPAGSAWIGPADSNELAPPGDYVYTVQFWLSEFDAGMVELSGEFASDNKTRIFINGKDAGFSNSVVQYRGLTPFTIRNGFVAGLNTLEFRTTNGAPRKPNPTGLLVANLKLASKATELTAAPLAPATPKTIQTPDTTQPPFVATPVSPALLRDDAFGYALPDGIGLTHLVEASTDLTHWSPATNVVFFFKDLESTNFNERYYRFQEK